MYVRKLKSPNGKTYIQVIDKNSGKYKVIKSLGSAKDKKSIENLINKHQPNADKPRQIVI